VRRAMNSKRCVFVCFTSPCLFAAICLFSAGRSWAQMATEDRLLYRGWWPRHSTPSADAYVGAAECARCHVEEAATQKNTPMGRTAASAADSEILKSHSRLAFQAGPTGYQIMTAIGRSLYTVTDGNRTTSASLTWSFGDGHIGQSYLFEREGTVYESRVSYFGALNGLDFTPGRKLTEPKDLEQAMARPVTGSELVRCFACHNTASTIANKFDSSRMIPGITCQACHGPGLNHVIEHEVEQAQGTRGPGSETIFDPGNLAPLDAVDFCGACHGTYWDVKLEGLVGIANVRAQPYRLEKSRCWGTKGDARLTCVACHNPHQPLVRDAGAYDKICLNCHRTTSTANRTADHPGLSCNVATKDCVSCHMPRYEDSMMHHTFTDHYIRVVAPASTYPD
jgi:Cytochrome c3